MKCWVCKKHITKAHIAYIKARNKREKDNVRDLCDDCYIKYMNDRGYVYNVKENMWKYKEGM